MQSQTFSSTLIGIEARLVRVEVAISNGLPGLVIVGLPDAAVNEAGARVRSALRACDFAWPPRRVVVNLSPADLRKQGSGFDLAIALGILEALGELTGEGLSRSLIIGELSLDGTIRPVKGLVPTLRMAARSPGIDRVLVSSEQPEREFMADGVRVYPLSHLSEAARALSAGQPVVSAPAPRQLPPPPPARDLSEVRGQPTARWALEIAAAGGHHLMLTGPPGCGKSLLAACLPGILPPLTPSEWLEVASVASVCQDASVPRVRPFRSPGQGTSAVGMLGGQQPGEVTRAHHGVLFLDEFPEFRRDTLEALRQVMETGEVSVVRARMRVMYPARFTLVAAMNPCPCGQHGAPGESCQCTELQRQRYAAKLSGPLRDRFDLLVALERQGLDCFIGSQPAVSESSEAVRARVVLARQAQQQRGCLNRDLRGSLLRRILDLSAADERFCQETGDRLNLSVRGLEKWLKVARTIADLALAAQVTRQHLYHALTVRGPGKEKPLAV
jgi:magnesium chelatase family protein